MHHFFEAAPGVEGGHKKGSVAHAPGRGARGSWRVRLAGPLLAAGTLLAVATAAQAATFTLSDGTTVEGEIVHVTRNTLMVRLMTGGGLRQLSRHDLKSVTIDTETEGTVVGSLESWNNGVYEVESEGRLLKLKNREVVAESALKPPELTISDAKDSEAAGELIFHLELSRPSDSQILVIYATLDRTAKAGVDFEESRGSITLRAGDTTAQIKVPLINNDLADDDKYFEVFVATDQKVATITSKRATGTIVNDDKKAALDQNVSGGQDGGQKPKVESGEEISLKNTE